MANNTAAFQPKVPISTIRSEFPNAKLMVAVGGWGDTVGFTEATKSDAGITKFAGDVKSMVGSLGVDGVGMLSSSSSSSSCSVFENGWIEHGVWGGGLVMKTDLLTGR